ncbi:hypothetical protein KCP76_24740 [Salmonella enterica subsp. enterica serovar Weltevreden]|nr:hypothetical protein KCP76_24740 [Salmonella enterica subsp. enterica serovar Weltevreden]
MLNDALVTQNVQRPGCSAFSDKQTEATCAGRPPARASDRQQQPTGSLLVEKAQWLARAWRRM